MDRCLYEEFYIDLHKLGHWINFITIIRILLSVHHIVNNSKNGKVRINVLENYANCVLTLG